MHIIKKLLKGLLPLMLMFLMAVPAFAAEVTFADVTPDSLWSEGINYVAEEGISVGTGNNCFSPDLAITGRQWAVMVCRALDKQPDPQHATAFGAAEVRLGYDEGWLGLYGMLEPDIRMSRGSMYESAFRAFGVPIYSYELFEDGTTMATRENCMRIAKELGICPEGGASNDIMTRGETAQLVYLLSTKEYQVAEPPIMSEMQIVNVHGLNLNSFLLEIEEVPELIRKKFAELGWRYIVDYDAITRFSEELGLNCIGVCSYSDKAIFVSDSSATIHEFGHFIHRVVGFPPEFDAIYERESQNTLSLLRDYSLTNSKEYFADCFKYWVENQADDGRMDLLRHAAPETYAYFSRLASNGWAKR